MDIAKELKTAIILRIACIEKPSINGFAGTGKSRRRTTADIHAIARQIAECPSLKTFSFRWNFGNFEPASDTEIYLTIFTALFDVDDEDARQWTDSTMWDAARHEGAWSIARALTRKFEVIRREIVYTDKGGPHNSSTVTWSED